jgi:hypothetical protein
MTMMLNINLPGDQGIEQLKSRPANITQMIIK